MLNIEAGLKLTQSNQYDGLPYNAYFIWLALPYKKPSVAYAVQFQSVHHPTMTVTHLTKIYVRHFAWKPVTWAKFCQVLPFVWPFRQCWVLNLRWWYTVETKIGVLWLKTSNFGKNYLIKISVTNYPFVKWPCDLWQGPNFISSGSSVTCDRQIDWNCTVWLICAGQVPYGLFGHICPYRVILNFPT